MYSGKFPIGSLELDCYVLNDEKNTRILSDSAMFEALDRKRKGSDPSRGPYDNLTKLPAFCDSKSLFLYINSDFLALTKVIEFKDGDNIKKGYKADLLPEVCSLYVRARADNALTKKNK